MVRLRVVPCRGDPFFHTLEGESLVIGRSAEAELEIPDRFLSRLHARLFLDKDSWWVEDLDSRNGTRINGRPIKKPSTFKPGDELRLSASFITFADYAEAITQVAARPRVTEQIADYRPATDLIERPQLDSTPDPAAPDKLERQASRLQILNETHRTLAHTLEMDELLELILDRSFAALNAEEAVIYLNRPGGGYYRAAWRGDPALETDHLYSQTLLHEVADKGMTALVSEVTSDPRFSRADSVVDAGYHSLVAAPLLGPEGSQGMIALTCRLHSNFFDEDDMEMLTSLSSIAALRMHSVRLARQAALAVAEQHRLEAEVDLARKIQMALVPQQPPDLKGFEIAASNTPSRGVSGDYYSWTERLEGTECVLVLADVSGKGIAASLLASSLEALAAGPIEIGRSSAEICSRVSPRLHQRTVPEQFVTMFVVVLRPDNDRLTFTNAGNSPAFVVRHDGKVELLESSNPPVGLFEKSQFVEVPLDLTENDLMVIYTDGITEAISSCEEEYGLERLIAVSRRHAGEELPALLRVIETDLAQFVEAAPFEDDRTLILVRRT